MMKSDNLSEHSHDSQIAMVAGTPLALATGYLVFGYALTIASSMAVEVTMGSLAFAIMA